MKKILLTTILIYSLFSCSNDNDSNNNEDINIQLTQCIPTELQGNLIAFYPFNDGSLDDVSNSNDLTNLTSASPTIDRNGNIDCAYKFESQNNDYLTTTNTTFLDNLSEFSISLWFKSNNSDSSILISRDESVHYSWEFFGQWTIGLYDNDYPVFAFINASMIWDLYDLPENTEIDLNEWHHLVATFNTTNHELKIYRDGILRDSSTGIIFDNPNVPSYQDIGDLFIGKYFDGQIDDIAIFNKALNQNEITEMFQIESCCL